MCLIISKLLHTTGGGGEGGHGDGGVAASVSSSSRGDGGAALTGRGAAATRPPWWRFWPGSEKPHQSPDGPAAARSGMTKPKERCVRRGDHVKPRLRHGRLVQQMARSVAPC